MTNEEILKKAIERAIKNGWVKYPEMSLGRKYMPLWKVKEWILEHGYYSIIFSHDFAKAFWYCDHESKEYVAGTYLEHCNKCGQTKMIGGKYDDWEYHLKEMVLKTEPLKYLEEFLNVNMSKL